MSTRSIWDLEEPARPVETRTFTDPEQPDFELELTMRRLIGAPRTAAARLGAEYITRFVTGEKDAAGAVLKPPQKLPIPNGKKADVDEEICRVAAEAYHMWSGDPKKRPGLPEVVGWRQMLPTGYIEISNWMWRLNFPKEGGQGNPSGQAAEPCLPESCDTTTNIQGSPSGETTST